MILKIVKATRYYFIFDKVVSLASKKQYLEAFNTLNKINKSDIKGRVLFRYELIEAILFYGLQEYQACIKLLEKLYASFDTSKLFNAHEKRYLQYYILEHYSNLNGFTELNGELLLEKIDQKKINLDFVAKTLKETFPI